VTTEQADRCRQAWSAFLHPTSKDAPQARGDDIDRGVDLSYNGGGFVPPTPLVWESSFGRQMDDRKSRQKKVVRGR
jgi:hypothetical protein